MLENKQAIAELEVGTLDKSSESNSGVVKAGGREGLVKLHDDPPAPFR